jgi:hypothetical protein
MPVVERSWITTFLGPRPGARVAGIVSVVGLITIVIKDIVESAEVCDQRTTLEICQGIVFIGKVGDT